LCVVHCSKSPRSQDRFVINVISGLRLRVRFGPISRHFVAAQYQSRWADFVAEIVFKGRVAGPRIFWPNVAEIMSRSAGSSTFCARASASRNEPNWVIGRKAAQRLRREAISASLSERHGRNGAVDLGLRPEGDGPGR